MHLFVVLFSAVFTVLQIHGYTCRVRSKLVNDHGGCDILFASHNPERKCLNYCYIGTKNEYSGEIIYIESIDSSNSFNWTVMAGTTKLESHSIVMKEIYNFEIIGGNYVKGIISLLVQTQELLFAVFIDVISPNAYDAIVIGKANHSTGTFWGQKIVAVKNFAEDVKVSVISLPSLKEGNGIFWMTLKKSIVNLKKPEFDGETLFVQNERKMYSFTTEQIIQYYSDFLSNKKAAEKRRAEINHFLSSLPKNDSTCRITSALFDWPQECYVNFIELSSLKNCSNVCYIGKKGEKLIFFASNGTFGQFYWLYITIDGDIHYLKINMENNSANAEQLAENMAHFAQAAISDDDIFFLLVSSNESNTMENARWFVINYETLMVNKTLSFTKFPKHLHNVEIFGGNLTYTCKNKNITKPIAEVIDFYNAQPIC